jgi:thioredoxin-related protein
MLRRVLSLPSSCCGCRAWSLLLAVALVLGLGLGLPVASHARNGQRSASSIAWTEARLVADVEAAFERARLDQKPVFLYWGAAWCPPCAQLQTTVFNRRDFVELSRRFVAVHIDGDAPGAQRLGAQFRVRGYPSVVLFSPQGEELTRLPGEVDATLYMDTLRMVLGGSATRAATRPAQRVLDDALAGRSLPVHEWRQLARYDWSEGEQRLVPDGQRARTLLRLARSCPAHLKVSQTRFLLKAAAASAPPGRPGALDEEGRFAAGAALTRMLGDPSQARDLMDLVTHDVQPVLAALTRDGTPGRVQLQRVWDQAAARLVADDGLSRSERLGAWQVRVELARMGRLPGDASLPPTLLGELQNHVDQWVRDSADAQERQSVVPAAAHLLAEAGRVAQAQQLLKAQLGQVVAPHFLMGQLASLARRRGDMADALQWSRRAWEQARGPAARLQWGVSHIGTLVDAAGDDAVGIESAAGVLLTELAGSPDAFHERNVRALERLAQRLRGWADQHPDGAGVLARLAVRLTPLCRQQPAGGGARLQCEALMRSGA